MEEPAWRLLTMTRSHSLHRMLMATLTAMAVLLQSVALAQTSCAVGGGDRHTMEAAHAAHGMAQRAAAADGSAASAAGNAANWATVAVNVLSDTGSDDGIAKGPGCCTTGHCAACSSLPAALDLSLDVMPADNLAASATPTRPGRTEAPATRPPIT
jgi:hypothetical protein